MCLSYCCILLFFDLEIQVIQCFGLNNPANSEVMVNGMSPGDTAIYTCDSGFELVGAATLTCGNDGQWNPAPPICRGEFSRN